MRGLVRFAVAWVIVVSACGQGARDANIVVPVQPPPVATKTPVAPPSSRPAAAGTPPTEDTYADGAPSPLVRPLDLAIKLETALFLGSNANDVWVTAGTHELVVSKTTGCVTEAYREPRAALSPNSRSSLDVRIAPLDSKVLMGHEARTAYAKAVRAPDRSESVNGHGQSLLGGKTRSRPLDGGLLRSFDTGGLRSTCVSRTPSRRGRS